MAAPTRDELESINLYSQKLVGEFAGLRLLEKQRQYMKERKLQQELTRALLKIEELLEKMLEMISAFERLPDDQFWLAVSVWQPGQSLQDFDWALHEPFVHERDVDGRGRHALRRIESKRREVVSRHARLWERIQASWERQLPELLAPAPSSKDPFEDAVPFDSKRLRATDR